MPTTIKPITVTYEIEHFYPDNMEVFVLEPTVRFVARKQPDIHLSTRSWIKFGKPRKIKVTIEPA